MDFSLCSIIIIIIFIIIITLVWVLRTRVKYDIPYNV